MAFEFREAKIEDALAISGLVANTWRHSFTEIVHPDTLANLTELTFSKGIAERIQDLSSATIIAEKDHEVAAFVTLCESLFDSDYNVGRVHSLFAAPEFQNYGIGAELLKLAMNWFQSQGFESAIVWTFSKNQAAIRFYETNGAVAFRARTIVFEGHEYEETCLKWESVAIACTIAN